jgi:hypothetical protein
MKISKLIPILNVVVTPNNILDLAIKSYEEFKKSDASHKDYTLTLCCSNSTQYDFRNNEFDTQEILKKLQDKRVVEVDINYDDFGKQRYLRIQLEHSTYRSGSIKVTADDEMWVNAIVETLHDLILTWKKQQRLVFLYSPWFYIGSFILIILSLEYLLSFIPSFGGASLNSVLFRIFESVCLIVAFSYPIFSGVSSLKELYPIVELSNGPEHLQEEAIKRSKITNIMSLYFLPCILAILVGIIQVILKIPH